MSYPSEQLNKLSDLPVLTDVIDTNSPEIPTLTEVVAEESSAFPAENKEENKELTTLSDAQYQHLATQIAPQLESLLRAKLAPQFDALWQEAWRQAKLNLPELIQARISTPPVPSPSAIIPPFLTAPDRIKSNTINMELTKSFEPQAIEARWYPIWESAGYFQAKLESDKPAYAIMLPPPNVTGTLHMGHAFQDTLMDALTRYHRMRGDNTL
ncbi:MAG: class I tRNA ligase family protein, partial [Candidatus Nitrotoga sp.]